MADGFNVYLEEYCSFCGDFEPDIEKMDVSSLGDSPRYLTDIKCLNRSTCERIKVNIEKNLISTE